MPVFSPRSKTNLEQCHPGLQRLFNHVILTYDCTVICGYRGKAEQNEAFRTGRSKLAFPNSRHNILPSRAVDVAPYPINWSTTGKNLARWYHFAGYVCGVADSLGIPIIFGGDWDGDRDFHDQTFDDLVHYELEDGWRVEI